MNKLLASACVFWALALSPAVGGEAKVQYVDGYFCNDILTLEALDEYLSSKQLKSFAYIQQLAPIQTSVQAFNDKLNTAISECLRVEEYVPLRVIGIYQPPWMSEGYPAFIVEIRLPNPDVEPKDWAILVGLKTNLEFYCNMMLPGNIQDGTLTILENQNCGLHHL